MPDSLTAFNNWMGREDAMDDMYLTKNLKKKPKPPRKPKPKPGY